MFGEWNELTISNIIMVIAVLLGPVLAIQAARFLDNRKEKRNGKLRLFRTLMSTRSYRTNWEHVTTLNNIDLEFSNKNNAKEKDVISAWKAYHDSLKDKRFSEKQEGYFFDLLQKMSIVLDYDFDITHIKNSSYAPVAHSNIELEHGKIRTGLIDILDRGKPLPIFSTNQDSQTQTISKVAKGLKQSGMLGEHVLALTHELTKVLKQNI